MFIKQIELRDALTEKITQHDARFHVAETVFPDPVQRLAGDANNIARIVCSLELKLTDFQPFPENALRVS
ncbi:hypothetical protein D3C72_2359160 [compost metagenome]